MLERHVRYSVSQAMQQYPGNAKCFRQYTIIKFICLSNVRNSTIYDSYLHVKVDAVSQTR